MDSILTIPRPIPDEAISRAARALGVEGVRVTPGVPTKVIAASMGLAAFALAIVAGLSADNAADHILIRAIGSMFACSLLGLAVGAVAERAAAEAIEDYEKKNPVPVRGAGASTAKQERSEEVLAA